LLHVQPPAARAGEGSVQATRVSPEFDQRLRAIAEHENKLLVEVLEDALEAYENSR
jgi:predicted DNA-binding protein